MYPLFEGFAYFWIGKGLQFGTHIKHRKITGISLISRLAPVLKTIFHQCVISYTCSQSNSDGSTQRVEPSELDWLQVYDMTH